MTQNAYCVKISTNEENVEKELVYYGNENIIIREIKKIDIGEPATKDILISRHILEKFIEMIQ